MYVQNHLHKLTKKFTGHQGRRRRRRLSVVNIQRIRTIDSILDSTTTRDIYLIINLSIFYISCLSATCYTVLASSVFYIVL